MSGDGSHPRIFFDLPPEVTDPESAAAVLVPVPYDRTASWLRGAAGGPEAILEASRYVEVWDIETASEPWRSGIAAVEPVLCEQGPEVLAERVSERVGAILERDQLPVVLGGEHSVSLGAIRATTERYPGLSLLQIDAHADTRDSYQGSRYNHACIIARARELCPVVQVGIRSADSDEIPLLEPERVFWAHDIVSAPLDEWIQAVVDLLSDEVYVTIDVDAFDPSIIPATGTPEPGGLDWYQVNRLLAAVARRREVVGFDVVELISGHPASAFTAAKLIYRFLAEIWTGD